MLFKTYEFIFDDTPSSMYGLYICDFGNSNNQDVSFGNRAEIVERKINNRVRPLFYGVDYNKDPLTFNLTFASTKELDRWEMQEIAMWLTGHNDYRWLIVEQCDMQMVRYRCLITELSPISVGWAPYAFTATIRCDCPYAYGEYFNYTKVAKKNIMFNIFNEGTANVPCKPIMEFTKPGGDVQVRLTNKSNGCIFLLDNMPRSQIRIKIDNENGIIQDITLGQDLYQYFNDQFFYLSPGDNNIVSTINTNIRFEGAYYYNIGA